MCLGVLLVPFGVPCVDLVDQCGLRRDTAPKALPTKMAAFDFRHVEPTAMVGGRMDVSFIGDSFGLIPNPRNSCAPHHGTFAVYHVL
jgi:hypothetical protein